MYYTSLGLQVFLKVLANKVLPALYATFPFEFRNMVRVTFKGIYNQTKFYTIVFWDQFKGHIAIAGILQKFPIIGYFLLGYHLVHFPEVGKYAILDLDYKLDRKSVV